MRGSVCVEPEESSALIIQSNVDKDADAGVVLKRYCLNALHVIVFGKSLLVIVRIGVALTLILCCDDNYVDVFLLGKLFRCIFDIIDLFACEKIGVIDDLDGLLR